MHPWHDSPIVANESQHLKLCASHLLLKQELCNATIGLLALHMGRELDSLAVENLHVAAVSYT